MAAASGMALVRRPWMTNSLELFALSAFAVAQPLFDVLGRHATFFVASRASKPQIVLLVVLVTAVPALVLIALARAAGWLWPRGERPIHLALIGLLAGIAITPPLARAMGFGLLGWCTTWLVSGVGSTAAYVRWGGVREALRWAALSPQAFAIVFLLGSPVRTLVLPDAGRVERAAPKRDVPVVVVVFDEVPLGSLLKADGSLDASRFPGFARLASNSTWYRHATTSAETTADAIPSLLTGRWMTERRLPTATAHPDNLLTLFAATHGVHATEFVSSMCPHPLCDRARERPRLATLLADIGIIYLHTLLPADVARGRLPALTGRWSGFVGQRPADTGWAAGDHDDTAAAGDPHDAIDRFERALALIVHERTPVLHYLHVALPHLPWTFLPSKQAYDGMAIPGLAPNEQWDDDQATVDHALQRYLLQLALADRLLGDLLDRLHQQGLDREALLVVLSDHGASFRPGGSRRTLDESNAADILPIPLFIKFPGQETASVDERPATLVDVLPTIADVLEMPVPWQTDGSTLRGALPDRPVRRAFSNSRGLMTFPASRHLDLTLSERIERLFGARGGADDLYRMGPYRDLVGQPAAALLAPDGDRSTIRVHLDGSPGRQGSASARFVPALVSASLSDGMSTGTPVAVAVDGTIAGLGWTYRDFERTRLSVMVSPRWFRDAGAAIEVYRVTPESRLVRLPHGDESPHLLSLDSSGRVTEIVTRDGWLPVGRAGLTGRIDPPVPGGRLVQVGGWALDLTNRRIPRLFLVVRYGAVVSAIVPGPRPDVAAHFKNDDFARCGVRFATAIEDDLRDVEVYALFDDAAYLLPRPHVD